MQEAVDVPVPCLNTFLQCLNGDAVSCPFVQCAETETGTISLAVFQIVGHRVEADFVSALQKFFQTESGVLFAGNGRSFPESFHFRIDIAEGST